MSRQGVERLAVVLIGAMIVAIALLTIFKDPSPTEFDTIYSATTSSQFPDRAIYIRDGDLNDVADVSGSDRRIRFEGVLRNCQTRDDELTEKCLESLNQWYAEELTVASPLVPVCDQPTWSQVFHDPIGKREQAIQALSREECRAEPDEIRSSEDCARNAIAELSALHRRCTEVNEHRSGVELNTTVLSAMRSYTGSEPPILARPGLFWLDEHYRERWIVAQCEMIDESVFAPITELEGIYTGHLELWFPESGSEADIVADEAAKGPIWQEKERIRIRNQGNTLRAAAARLGHLWALSEHDIYHLHMDDLFGVNPAQALIFRGHRQKNLIHNRSRYREEPKHLEAMWASLEEISPGIQERFDSTPLGDVFAEDTDGDVNTRWEPEDPAVRELVADHHSKKDERREVRDRTARSIYRAHVRAALQLMQRMDIDYNENALPDWTEVLSEEELGMAQEILDWMDEKYPQARHAPNPGAKESCGPFIADTLSGSEYHDVTP